MLHWIELGVMVIGWAFVVRTIVKVGPKNLWAAARNPQVPWYWKALVVVALVVELGPLDDLVLAFALRRVGLHHSLSQS